MSQVAAPTDVNTVVSLEQDGRVLSGVGVTADDLAATMERHAPTDPADPTEKPSAEPPQLAKGRRRYSELTAERDEAKKAADAAEAKARELEAKLAEKSQAPAPVPPTPVAPPVAAAPAAPAAAVESRTKPREDQIGSVYPTYADFVEDLSDWKAEQRIAKLDLDARLDARVTQTLERTQQARTFDDQATQTIDRGRKAYADFDQVKASGAGAWVELPMDRVLAIVQHPKSEHLQYAIMKDHALAQKVASCPAFEFGLVLASILPATTAAPVVAAPLPPAPYTPVGSGTKTTTTASADLVNGYDFDSSGYREKRAAERQQTRSTRR